MNELSIIQRVVIWALPVILAVTVHESAHAWAAKKLGDSTAMMLGRMTLNPLKHIDPIGTIVVPLIMVTLSGFILGWAKPVPITWENLKQPKRDMVLVALAGPLSNLMMALLWAILMKLGLVIGNTIEWLSIPLVYMGYAGILINIMLMILNLIPLPPLDGGRVLTGILPGPLSWQVSRLEPFGMIILLGLFATGLLGKVLFPLVQSVVGSINVIFGL